MNVINWLRGEQEQVDLSGLAILERARIYLERYGDGRDNEFARARHILIQARARLLNQQV